MSHSGPTDARTPDARFFENMLPIRRRAALFALALGACVPSPEVGHHELRTEDRPIEDGIDTLRQGLIQCDPRSEQGYSSGTPFAITVVTVDGKPAELQTANAYYVMQSAAARDGVSLRVVSGFRSYDEQAYLYSCYVNCSCNNCNLAAFPGYSNHQSGFALDLNTYERGVLGWLNRNGGTYGFYRTVPSEDWHWEFFGPPRAPGPCGADRPPQSPLAFSDLEEGGHYQNGVWIKVRYDGPAEPAVHHVRYFADDWLLGISEEAEDEFSLRYTFSQPGQRRIRAVAYGADNRALAEREVTIVVTGEASNARVDFVSPEDGGWYRNGVTFRMEPSNAQVAQVVYFAGAYELGRSTESETGFALTYTFQQMGYRAIRAVALDSGGRELARKTVGIRVLPGNEGPVAVRLVSPDEGRSYQNGLTFRTVGSDSIERVVYSADGWTFGSSSDRGRNFAVDYTFSQIGEREVLVRGFDAQGSLLAEDRARITVE